MNERRKPQLLILVGPTAVGKTNVSLNIAEQFDCEIISGDSMQVYRGMDIGTAKATLEERAAIPHHLIDIRDPEEPFTVSDFQSLAREAMEDISSRGKLPFIVGGTGLYIQSVAYDYKFTEAAIDESFRQEMNHYADIHGETALHDKLREVDSESAARLHPNDRRRVVRALEVYRLTGKKWSDQQKSQPETSPYDLCIIGLTMDRQVLYRRIEERVDAMLAAGLADEVRLLLDRGIDPAAVSMQGLGYKEMAAYLLGQMSYDEAVELLKRDTRRFAKRQLSWFRSMKQIHWVEASETSNFFPPLQTISDIIAGKFVSSLEYISKQFYE